MIDTFDCKNLTFTVKKKPGQRYLLSLCCFSVRLVIYLDCNKYRHNFILYIHQRCSPGHVLSNTIGVPDTCLGDGNKNFLERVRTFLKTFYAQI